jgi:hypothetical protein
LAGCHPRIARRTTESHLSSIDLGLYVRIV